MNGLELQPIWMEVEILNRFFVNKEQLQGDIVSITGEDIKHISNVLRLGAGDKIIVCDKEETDYICQITVAGKKEILAKVVEKHRNENEPDIKITLYQAVPKLAKMEMAIQKCVEIGVDSIVPVITENTVVKIGDNAEKKLERWNRIALSAAKQCMRGKIPAVKPIMDFKAAIRECRLDAKVIPYEKERNSSLRSFARGFNGRSAAIFIGPEGGYSETEIKFAVENGCIPVSLGRRILRTETAGMAASIILLYELEGFE